MKLNHAQKKNPNHYAATHLTSLPFANSFSIIHTDQPNHSDAFNSFDFGPASSFATVPIPYPRHPPASQAWNGYPHHPTDQGLHPAFEFAPGVAADAPSSHSVPAFLPGDVANTELSQGLQNQDEKTRRVFAEFINFNHPQLEASNSVNITYLPPFHHSSSSLASALTMGSSAEKSPIPVLSSCLVTPPTQEDVGASGHSMIALSSTLPPFHHSSSSLASALTMSSSVEKSPILVLSSSLVVPPTQEDVGASGHCMMALSSKRKRPLVDDVGSPASAASTSNSKGRKGKEKARKPPKKPWSFFCGICKKDFRMARKRHMTMHNIFREYQCLCETEFTRKDKRNAHVRAKRKGSKCGYPNGDKNSGRIDEGRSGSSTSSANQLQIASDDFAPSPQEETTQQQPQASSSRGTVTNGRRRSQDSTKEMRTPVSSSLQENPVAVHPPAQMRKRQKRNAKKALDQSGEDASSNASSSTTDASMSMNPDVYGSYPSMPGAHPSYFDSVPSSFYQATPSGSFPQQQQQTNGLFLPESCYHQNQLFQNQGPSSVQYHDQSVSPSNDSPPALSSSSSTPVSVNSSLVSTPYARLPAPGVGQFTFSMPFPIVGASSHGGPRVDCDAAFSVGMGLGLMINGDDNERGIAQVGANNAGAGQYSNQHGWRLMGNRF